MGSYNWENPGQSYQDAMQQTFTAPQFNDATQAPGAEGNAFIAASRAKAQNEMAMENANNLERMNRIQQLEIEIPRLQEKVREIHERRKTVEAQFEENKKANQKKCDDMELRIAANRAKRGDGGDFYRWKKNKDANYKWQSEMNSAEQQIAEISNRNEYNERLNKALDIWQKAKGDPTAEAYAKQNVDGLLELGKAKFGVDFSGKIAEAEGLAQKKAADDAAAMEEQKKLAKTQYTNYLKFDEKKPATTKNPAQVTKWKTQIREAFEAGEINEEQARDLLNMEESMATKKAKKKQDAAIDLSVDDQKASAAASKLTLSELLGKSSLNKWEEQALDAKYPVSQRQSDAAAYNALTTGAERKNWSARNPGKLAYLKKKGLVK